MHILIVDMEYLIAMEAERMLADAFPEAKIEIATPRDFLVLLAFERFDIAVIDTSLLPDQASAVNRLKSGGPAMVFSTFRDDEMVGVAGFEGTPVVAKPFHDNALILAVKSAAR